MIFTIHHQLNHLKIMIFDYMIFPEMYGNGVQIYITVIIIQPFQIRLLITQKVQQKVLTLMIHLVPKE